MRTAGHTAGRLLPCLTAGALAISLVILGGCGSGSDTSTSNSASSLALPASLHVPDGYVSLRCVPPTQQALCFGRAVSLVLDSNVTEKLAAAAGLSLSRAHISCNPHGPRTRVPHKAIRRCEGIGTIGDHRLLIEVYSVTIATASGNQPTTLSGTELAPVSAYIRPLA